VNEFVKRVRAAKIHVLIMGHLRKQMPAMMGKQKAQDKLLRDLPSHFAHVQREHHLPAGPPRPGAPPALGPAARPCLPACPNARAWRAGRRGAWRGLAQGRLAAGLL